MHRNAVQRTLHGFGKTGHAWIGSAFLAALHLGGCGSGCEDDPPPEPPRPKPVERPPLVAPRPIATGAAFDLASTKGTTVFAWGRPTRLGGGIRILSLDSMGGPKSEEQNVVEPGQRGGGAATETIPADAVELVAAVAGGRVGLAWVLREQRRFRVFSAAGHASGMRFAAPHDRGQLGAPEAGGRGSLAIAASPEGDLSLVYRQRSGPCANRKAGRCAQFRVRRLIGGERIPLSVPEPCAHAVAGHQWASGTWYYGLCSRETGAPITTTYAITFDPQYAHASQALQGCEPTGMVRAAEAVVVVGECQNVRRAVTLSNRGQTQRPLGAITPEVTCNARVPSIQLGSTPPFEVRLKDPMDRLEVILPEKVAPRGSRAVWTGRAILVAVPIGAEVSVRRLQCEDGALRTTTPL